MTNPTTTIAWPLAQQVATLIDAKSATTGATVHAAWPGDKNAKSQMVVIEDLKVPEVTIPGSKSGRVERRETVTMTVKIYVGGQTFRTADEVMDRCSELIAAVQDVFADDMSLGATPGVHFSEITDYGFDYAELAEGGWMAVGSVSVSIKVELL